MFRLTNNNLYQHYYICGLNDRTCFNNSFKLQSSKTKPESKSDEKRTSEKKKKSESGDEGSRTKKKRVSDSSSEEEEKKKDKKEKTSEKKKSSTSSSSEKKTGFHRGLKAEKIIGKPFICYFFIITVFSVTL